MPGAGVQWGRTVTDDVPWTRESIPAAVSFPCEVLVTRAPPRWLGSLLCGGFSAGAFVLSAILGGGAGALAAFAGIGLAMATLLLLPGISGPRERWHTDLPAGKTTTVVGLDGLLIGSTFIAYENLNEVSRARGRLWVVKISDHAGAYTLLSVIDGASKLIAAIDARRGLHERLRKPKWIRKSDGYRNVRVEEVVPSLEEAVAEREWAHEDVEEHLEDALVQPASE